MTINLFKKTSRKDPSRLLYEDPIFSPSEIYHEASSLTQANLPCFTHRIQSILSQQSFLKRISQGYKTYPTSQSFALAAPIETPEQHGSQALRELITSRRSTREFSDREVALNDLGLILQNSYGISGSVTLPYKIEQKLRVVPSAGALYPLELYAVCFRVGGLEPGIYHYNVLENLLEFVRPGQLREEFGRALFYEGMFQRLGVLVLITGLLKRTALKYGERGYRFMLLEAGHVGQNICLTVSALNLGAVMLGGFMDGELNQLLGIDGVHEATLYAAAVGCIT